jgi:hypothetical protein
METPRNHHNSKTQEGEVVPQGWDRTIPPTAGDTIPTPRGTEHTDTNTDASDTYVLPQAEPQTVELQNRPETTQTDQKKRFGLGAKIGAAVAGAAVVAGAGFMLGAKGRSDEMATPEFGSQPSVGASEVPGPTSQAPASETTAEKAPKAVFTIGPDSKEVTVEDLKNITRVTSSEASTIEQAAQVYIKKPFEAAANMNVSPKAKYGKPEAGLQINKDLLTSGLFAGLGKKHNEISEVVLDDYIEFGTVASKINHANLYNNTYSDMQLEITNSYGSLNEGGTVVGKVIVSPKDILVKTDEPGTKVYLVTIKAKLNKTTGEIDYSGTYFSKAR